MRMKKSTFMKMIELKNNWSQDSQLTSYISNFSILGYCGWIWLRYWSLTSLFMLPQLLLRWLRQAYIRLVLSSTSTFNYINADVDVKHKCYCRELDLHQSLASKKGLIINNLCLPRDAKYDQADCGAHPESDLHVRRGSRRPSGLEMTRKDLIRLLHFTLMQTAI